MCAVHGWLMDAQGWVGAQEIQANASNCWDDIVTSVIWGIPVVNQSVKDHK